MSYYDKPEEYAALGIDYDLYACLQYNPQDDFALDDIQHVLAVYEGEHDGADWRWILSLKDGRYVALQGGCDYTGWDCQSSAGSTIYLMIAEALGHFKEQGEVWVSLARQLATGKAATWHEQTGRDLGI